MLRKINKDFGRYKAGELKDYPIGVWKRLAEEQKCTLDDLAELIETNTALQSMLKGRTPTPQLRQGVQQQRGGKGR